uniref:Uncharacterized protein n=1 Tax=Dinoroseobacter phage vB_DshS_R26L TaxID=3161158 RepID=A0AAU7VGW6_9CAUD
MNYLLARNAFLASIGKPEGEDRLRAIAAFDQTVAAHTARFWDAYAEFMEQGRKSLGLR